MFESIRDAGPFMWLLVVLSVVSLTFILDRAWALRRSPGAAAVPWQMPCRRSRPGRAADVLPRHAVRRWPG
jgi:hypothetical protein